MADKPQLSPDEILALATQGLEDPGFFCRTFFPEWFYLPMPWVHRGVLAILTRQTDWLLKFGEERWPRGVGTWDEAQLDKILRHFVWRPTPDDPTSAVIPIFEAEQGPDGKIKAIHMRASNRMLLIMPRGISKTTLVNAANIRDIVQHDVNFLVYLSETATHSEEQLNNIKRELESNELLKMVYGVKQPTRSDPESWSQTLIETTDGITVAAKGRGGQVRGMNHRGKRPNRIIFDDVEDKESVKTDDQRNKARTWLKSDVEPALPQIGNERGDLLGLGTIIHFDSLLVNLSNDPEWVVVKFGAIDPDGDMLWDHYMTRDQYTRKRLSFVRMGKLAEFGMEYDSSIKVEDSKAKFTGPFTYVVHERKDFVGLALVCDPAISEKKISDFCSFAVVGMTEQGKVHVVDFYAEVGMSPREQVDKYFELHFKHDPNLHGIEAVAWQKALIHLVREEMFRKGKIFGSRAYFQIEPILHGNTGKVERVEGTLSPRYSSGYVTHQRRFPQLEQQLLDWPNAKKDGPDVVAMAVTLLDPYAAFALDGEDDGGIDKLAQDQYPPLDEEIGRWRAAP